MSQKSSVPTSRQFCLTGVEAAQRAPTAELPSWRTDRLSSSPAHQLALFVRRAERR